MSGLFVVSLASYETWALMSDERKQEAQETFMNRFPKYAYHENGERKLVDMWSHSAEIFDASELQFMCDLGMHVVVKKAAFV